MSWIRMDDSLYDHPKVLRAGPLAFALHISALGYCGRHLTDGTIPREAVPSLSHFDGIGLFDSSRGEQAGPLLRVDVYALADRLVEVGLWEKNGGDYRIHDYLDYNPTRERVEAEREAARVRMRKSREGRSPEVRPKFSDPVPDPSPSPEVRKVLRVPRVTSEGRPRMGDAGAPPSERELAAIEVSFQREAERAWSETARQVGNPYTTRFHLRQVVQQAVTATRWADQAVVLDAIRTSMEAGSAPVRIPEWARLHGADLREREHQARKMAERDVAERVVVERVPGGDQTYLGHVPVLSGSVCTRCGKGLAAHRMARASDLRSVREIVERMPAAVSS